MSCQSFNVTTRSRRFSVRMLPMPKIAATLMTPSPRTSMCVARQMLGAVAISSRRSMARMRVTSSATRL